jgi:hypothetical protein
MSEIPAVAKRGMVAGGRIRIGGRMLHRPQRKHGYVHAAGTGTMEVPQS